MRRVQNEKVTGKNVCLVVDYNIAIEQNILMSTYKVDATVNTIKYLIQQKAKSVFIVTHLGRPKSKEEYCVEPIRKYLSTLFPELASVSIAECIEKTYCKPNTSATTCVKQTLIFGDNIRYYNAEDLTTFYNSFDLVVNDAFGCAHRQAMFRGCAGLLMQKEIDALNEVKACDLLIVGGAKAQDKLELVEQFECTAFLGGLLGVAALNNKEAVQSKAVLPKDFLVINTNGKYQNKKEEELLESDRVIDIGTETVAILTGLIQKAKIIFWNGPLGKFEDEHATGTKKIVNELAKAQAKVIAGGGETLISIEKYAKIEQFYHVSTGGGAMLSYLGNKKMPGIEALE